MKSVLAYGQAVNARNRGKAQGLDVFVAGISAMREGCNLKAFERVNTPTGVTIIRKRR